VLVFVRRFFFQIDNKGHAPVLGAGGHLQHANLHIQSLVNGRHPARVAAGQVIVDRDQVHAAPGERVEIQRQGGHQRFALAGAHLGDACVVQRQPTDQLYIIMAQPDGALAGLAHRGKRLGQQVVQGFAVGQPRSKRGGAAAQVVVAEFLKPRLELVDLLDDRGKFFQIALNGITAEKAGYFL